ncbi:MAG: HAD-IIB family hydrolase [bacterium]|nr:HAD-IIB family hydrolase [bacterium]
MPKNDGLYVFMISVHGLVRGHEMELGSDADTGGQIKYVVELARALSDHSRVARIDLATRRVFDPRIDDSYSEPEEQLSDKARIVRLPCGPRRYLRKESLWPYLDAFADECIKHFRRIGRIPHVIHGHYADAGYLAAKLANLLGVPMVFTGHSLGRVKNERLLESGLSQETIARRYNIEPRIEAEEEALNTASLVVVSTSQEIEEQYERYQNYQTDKMVVIPPGIDLERFYPPARFQFQHTYMQELSRFLQEPRKPMILALSRPDERKNITTLIKAYGENDELKRMANLVIVAGNRDDYREMDTGARDVLNEILYLIDRYDLYGRVAYPKHHVADEVPDIYRIAAKTRGVFVNPALTEPFGLTLIEAAACGLPIVATNDGGPRDITANCSNGSLIDPLNSEDMADAITEILRNPTRWRNLSRNGLRGVRRHYSWSGHVKTYVQTIQRFIRDARPKPFWTTSGKRLLSSDRLVISDIDNTLIGDSESLQELMKRLKSSDRKIGFGIATGRHLQSCLQAFDEWKVPRPDILITSVGAEIYYGHDLSPDADWTRHLDYRWEPDRLREFMQQFEGVLIQEDEFQRRHKLSFYYDPNVAPSKRDIIREIRRNKFQVKTIFSHQQYLDFLPIRASKGLAVWYLANKWGLPMDHILVAGDSGNDEEMLASSALSVVVGNHDPELAHLKGSPTIYFAQGEYARGILEGADHYGFFGDIRVPHKEEA